MLFFTQYGVMYRSIRSVVGVSGLRSVDDSGGQVFWEADLEGRLHELWGVVVLIQHSAQHRGGARKRLRAGVTGLH